MIVNQKALAKYRKMQADFFDARDEGKDTPEMFKRMVAFAYKHGFGQILEDPDDLPSVKKKPARRNKPAAKPKRLPRSPRHS